jgi:hypothetical protein
MAQESFFYLLQCALFKSYVIFTKSNPNSHQSFPDYFVDVSEFLINTTEAVSAPSSDESQVSSRIPTPIPPKRAPKSDSPGGLHGKMKSYKLIHIITLRCIRITIVAVESSSEYFECILPWVQKLTDPQLVKKFLAFYGTRWFM